MVESVLFEVRSPLGFHIRVERQRWIVIIETKHPVMLGRERAVRDALETPDEVRQSRSDPDVFLFYKRQHLKRWICAVVKRVDNGWGFLITAYPTDAIKEGGPVWTR